MIYEWREYAACDGRRHDLHRRFADHTLALFNRHGMHVVGFWADQADPDRIAYLLRFPDDKSRDQAWSAFNSDQEWLSVKSNSEASGPIVAEMRSVILASPDYWPHGTAREPVHNA
jgi:NIPSNAP